MVNLSIIIVNFNTENLLRTCLLSIYNNLPAVPLEIIVVDNSSRDNSIAMLKNEFPDVITICNNKNMGFGYANNLGVKKSKGTHILFLNSDTEVKHGTFDILLDVICSNSRIGVVGCRLIGRDGKIEESCGYFPTISAICLTKFSKILNLTLISGSSHMRILGNYNVDWVSGACLLSKRDILFSVGLFDEQFFLYSEDVDLCIRIKRAGWKILATNNTSIFHFRCGSQNTKTLFSPNYKRISQIYLYQKYHRYFLAVIFHVLMRIDIIVRLFQHKISEIRSHLLLIKK